MEARPYGRQQVRKLPRAYNRVREHNFSISGLEGFDIHGKAIGIIGTGAVSSLGFPCRLDCPTRPISCNDILAGVDYPRNLEATVLKATAPLQVKLDKLQRKSLTDLDPLSCWVTIHIRMKA